MSSSLEISVGTARTWTSRKVSLMANSVSSSFFASRSTITIFLHPSRAKDKAVSRPIPYNELAESAKVTGSLPEAAPVTSATPLKIDIFVSRL